MKKINKLNKEMINRHDVLSHEGKEIKRSPRWVFFFLDENIVA